MQHMTWQDMAGIPCPLHSRAITCCIVCCMAWSISATSAHEGQPHTFKHVSMLVWGNSRGIAGHGMNLSTTGCNGCKQDALRQAGCVPSHCCPPSPCLGRSRLAACPTWTIGWWATAGWCHTPLHALSGGAGHLQVQGQARDAASWHGSGRQRMARACPLANWAAPGLEGSIPRRRPKCCCSSPRTMRITTGAVQSEDQGSRHPWLVGAGDIEQR